ncbi:MAG: endonuclease/exonuclease/phosphatase family protein [Thermoplasmata archaeon]
MPGKLSVASWNVKNFHRKSTSKTDVRNHIKSMGPNGSGPDIFALLEVKGRDVWRSLYKEFPKHNFFITEGKQSQQILIAARKTLRHFITQRDDFKSGRTTLRPGPFLVVEVAPGDYYSLLFLHLKSFRTPVDLGLRDDQVEHAFHLRSAIDKAHQAAGGEGRAKFLFMGDINTQGMQYWQSTKISWDVEVNKLEERSREYDMTLAKKDYESTWTDGRGKFSDLDHVIASDTVNLQAWDGSNVQVLGWNKHPIGSQEFKNFVDKISDHCAIYCEILY